ncbi:MAG: helix-hairpin-helix domain-containing protein [Gammaproteobacteria bacterium]|nr:helix-hairpin-helix domain-containing protein [Gammaproteobacteria bacterium]
MKLNHFLFSLLISCGLFTAIIPASYAATLPKQPTAISSKININHASATELTNIKGIGIKKADAIVKYRTEHGNFKSLNDLTKIKGIGQKFLARLLQKNPGKLTF